MNLDNKKLFINNLKIKLISLVDKLLIELPINFNIIKTNLDDHYSFINFVELMNVYEDYKWNIIKEEYSKIKKKFNLDKKLYPQIIKIYGIVNTYYTPDEFNDMNTIIKKFNDDTILLNIEWEKFKKLHNILMNKRKNYIKNHKIIKIFKTNKDFDQFIERLYEIYNNLINLKKEMKILKGNKFLMYEKK
jgi:hypothetical protein